MGTTPTRTAFAAPQGGDSTLGAARRVLDMSTIWKPNVTVAAIIESDGRFLLVEEETADGLRLNQPAGHLDEGESLVNACARETLEETAHIFRPTHLVGIYQIRIPEKDVTYLRFAFAGEVLGFDETRGSRRRHRARAVADTRRNRSIGRPPPQPLCRAMREGLAGRAAFSARTDSPPSLELLTQ